MLDWVEKYRPKSLADIVGNKESVRQIADWARNWTPASPPLLIYGKPGVGKTTSAYALANDMNWEIVELNASDQRTKGIIERIAGTTSTTMSLLGASRKLLLLDEADNLHGTADKGGARAIIEVIKNAQQPIILIANDIYGVAREIKALCMPVMFRALQARSILPHLRYIASAEKKDTPDDSLATIAESANGDMRSAVNMLFAAGSGTSAISAETVTTSRKDERSSIFDLVTAILKGGREDARLLAISYDLSDTPDVTEQWIESSLPQIKSQKARSEAYAYLAEADMYLGRTYIRQYYTLWKYASALMILGVSTAARECGVSDRIMPPSRWGKISSAKKQKLLRTAVMNKFADMCKIPEDTFRDDYLKAVSAVADKDPLAFAKEYSLDKDELDFFLNDKVKAAAVIKDIQREEKEAEKKAKAEAKAEAKAKGKKTKTISGVQSQTSDNDIFSAAPNSVEVAKSASADDISTQEREESSKKKPSETQSSLFSF